MSLLRNTKVKLLDLKYSIQKKINEDAIHLLHYQMRNWGDAINPRFASFLTNRPIVSVDIDALKGNPANYQHDLHLGIGSIIHHATSNTVIWGSGLQEPIELLTKPKAITAVRGPHTREALLKQGIDCPDIYGDPALLLPRFYNPEGLAKTSKLGIISHIKDLQSPVFLKLKKHPDIKFISMRSNKLSLIDEALSCENIISTSLHGLVIADAYQIPARWIKVSNNIPGKDFKFHDYHASIGYDFKSGPLMLDQDADLKSIIKDCEIRELKINLEKLLSASPY